MIGWPVDPLSALFVRAATFALVFVIGGFVGYDLGWDRRDAQATKQLAEIESRLAEAERQARALKEKSRIIGNRYAQIVAEQREEISDLSRRVQDEINRMASGYRVALDSTIVRLLNELTPVREHVVREAPVPPLRVDAADATGPETGDRREGASERSVATWAARMIELYEKCRSRLHGLQAAVREGMCE